LLNSKGFKFIRVPKRTSPFSFFNLIVYNPGLHQPDELEKINCHGKIHSLQWHFPWIFFNWIHLFSAFQWRNPLVWLYKKTLSQTLELTLQTVCYKKHGKLQGNINTIAIKMPQQTNNIHPSSIHFFFHQSKNESVHVKQNRSKQFSKPGNFVL